MQARIEADAAGIDPPDSTVGNCLDTMVKLAAVYRGTGDGPAVQAEAHQVLASYGVRSDGFGDPGRDWDQPVLRRFGVDAFAPGRAEDALDAVLEAGRARRPI